MKRTRLNADPEKVRAFLNRSRKGLRPGKRKRRKPIPREVRARVYARTWGYCAVCAHEAGLSIGRLGGARKAEEAGVRRIAHPHHVLPVQQFPELELVGENMMGVCAEHHHAHHNSPNGRIPYEALPNVAKALARGNGPREAFLDRTYPRERPTPGGTR